MTKNDSYTDFSAIEWAIIYVELLQFIELSIPQ